MSSKLTLGGPARKFVGDSNTVISPTSEKTKPGPLKDYEGPKNITLRAQMTLSNV